MPITATELIAEPTAANIRAYLDARAEHSDARTEPYPHELEFCTDAHLEQIEAARLWWPQDAPSNCSFGMALIVGLSGYANPMDAMCSEDVMVHFMTVAQRAQDWLLEEGRDPANPNETREQRSARLGREAQKRRRSRTASGASVEERESADAVAAAWQAFLAACAERKRVCAELNAEVAAAQQAHRDLKEAHRVRFG